MVKRKTANSRLKRALAATSRNGVAKTAFDQGATPEARAKTARPCRYYGIIGNFASLQKFREGSRRIWRCRLSRRRRGRPLTWPRFLRLEKRYSLPRARVVHGLVGCVAKSCRRAGCLFDQASDLWGTWVGDHPGLPTRRRRNPRSTPSGTAGGKPLDVSARRGAVDALVAIARPPPSSRPHRRDELVPLRIVGESRGDLGRFNDALKLVSLAC